MTDTIPDKAADVISWIDEVEGTEQQRRALKAIAAENERSGGPRTTVVDHAEAIGEAAPTNQPGVGHAPSPVIKGPGPGR